MSLKRLARALEARRIDPWAERGPAHWTFRVFVDGFMVYDFHRDLT